MEPVVTKPINRDAIYRRCRFEAGIIELCVRWYILIFAISDPRWWQPCPVRGQKKRVR